MEPTHAIDLVWWITVVELPALCGLFWLNWRGRDQCETAQAQMRESLAAHRLEVAKNYVPNDYLKDVERRLTEHLLRIDAKLEASTLLRGTHPAGGAP